MPFPCSAPVALVTGQPSAREHEHPSSNHGRRQGTALKGGLSHPCRSPFVLFFCHRHLLRPWASHLVSVTTGAAWGQGCGLGMGAAGRGQSGAQGARSSLQGQYTGARPTTNIHASKRSHQTLLASVGAVKETWLHGGTSTLGNQGHLSSGAAVVGTAETGAAHGLWQALQRGTIQPPFNEIFWVVETKGQGSLPAGPADSVARRSTVLQHTRSVG